jgi:hypothetical protein
MKKQSFFSFSLLFMLGISPAFMEAAELRSTLGTVEIQKAGSGVWTQGRPRTEVQDGDIVRTGVGSQAELKMEQGHNMTLREKSTLKVDAQRGQEARFSLLLGRVRSFVAKLQPQSKFEIKTPVAVASVRGTVFELEVLENQTSRLSVLEGVVNYRDLAGIGAEVQVLQGQSVVVEPGAAPRPAEPLPQELREGLVPASEQEPALASLKMEIQRETGLASFKEFFQTDAAQEMKVAQYQEGKTLIDAFGKRVRLEEYISRPDPKQWSFVSLNTREDRFDFTRFDLYAKNDLPEDMSVSNLFGRNDHEEMTNWAVRTQRISSNSGDYYREWQDGGDPVKMTDSNGNKTTEVVFDHWYTEVGAEGQNPTLLSHWVPDAAFLGGNPAATKTRDDADLKTDAFQDTPSGYNDFEGADAGTVIGDTRGIDGFTRAQRLAYFDNTAVASSYMTSEGYSRDSVVNFDDKTLSAATIGEILNATKLSFIHTYSRPDGSNITLRDDRYTITDEGDKLSFNTVANLGSNLQGVNFQDVFTSSLMGERKIDVVISPSIFKKAGLLDN